MTREQVRDWHREKAKLARCDGDEQKAVLHGEMADAISAHIAEMGEPVGEVYAGAFGIHYIGCADPNKLPVGTKLYTAPPASGDWGWQARRRDQVKSQS
jgi:hypothetical protein